MSLLFLFIVLTDKTCHTVPMILITNSCFAGFSFTLILFWVTIFTLHNDLQQIYYQDLFCNFRGYMGYVTCFATMYSYFLQAIHSYLIVIYPTPVYNPLFVYIIPINGIIFIYLKLIRYVKEMNKRVTLVNKLLRAQRELKMVSRIVILTSIFLILGIPYTIFVFMGYFTSPPKYHFRIALTFIEISLVFVMIALFQFTDPIRTSIMKRINRQPNVVVATII
ncbi:unnamed protein product [Adineta steineri]|uniref:G-protein coupled receptors family 1 profile domain-containing protein n=2 Tax=Adineta steineri TaxID=433720 RepID=A0A814UAQ5_9BILA|nr:unnamed protein product [Adineta steineri]CAF1173279.1 unnamed protein product [Adineta steineri]CAF3834793.1 unnamed protein product [Adineta steineri]